MLPLTSSPVRRVAAIALLFAVVFLYRFNTLGGAHGGFDNDHFINLARANQLFVGDWPLRDYPDASLQGMWPPLTYLASAGAQLVAGRTLLAEALLTVGAVALAAVFTMRACALLTGRVWVGAVASLFAVALSIKLYGYARPLVFALAAVLLFRYFDRPTRRRLLALVLLGAAAFLVRHDYAIYVGGGAFVGLVARHWQEPWVAVRRLAAAAVMGLALLTPGLVLMHLHTGAGNYIASARALIVDERLRTETGWPLAVDGGTVDAAAALYYTFLVLPFIAVLVAALRARRGRASAHELESVLSLAAMAVAANHLLLRNNLDGRIADPAVLAALLGAWLAVVAWDAGNGLRRGLSRLATLALCVAAFTAAASVGDVNRELATAGVTDGIKGVGERLVRVWSALSDLPPAEWKAVPLDGSMLAAAYINECTGPRDRVLNAVYDADVLVFGRRPFAAGQVNFVPGFYSTPEEQQAAVARARRQYVPLALTGPRDTHVEDFVPDFPIVARYLDEVYVEAGTISESGGRQLRVLVHRGVTPLRPFRGTQLPCFR